jgi:hypothetical protein
MVNGSDISCDAKHDALSDWMEISAISGYCPLIRGRSDVSTPSTCPSCPKSSTFQQCSQRPTVSLSINTTGLGASEESSFFLSSLSSTPESSSVTPSWIYVRELSGCSFVSLSYSRHLLRKNATSFFPASSSKLARRSKPMTSLPPSQLQRQPTLSI